MKELVSAIENGLKKISKGNITRIELEETVASSRELYERLLIVRYKVYENSILANEESEELNLSCSKSGISVLGSALYTYGTRRC